MNTLHLSRQIKSAAFAFSSLLMIGHAFWLYAMGDYRAMLAPTFASLLLLSALLMHLAQNTIMPLPRMTLVAGLYLTTFVAFYHNPMLSMLWLGLPATAALILLPLWGALLLNALLLATLAFVVGNFLVSAELVLSFLALNLLLALPRWEHTRRQALLRATDPHDSDCNAYHIDTLRERLHSEYQRAALLNQRLAVLVMHLPQLDMAEEQFGYRAKQALLGALCSEVNTHSRDHDILGRAGDATFWLVLPDTSESGALLVRERLQRVLSRRVLVETGQLETRMAVCLPYARESFERYLKRLEGRAQALASA